MLIARGASRLGVGRVQRQVWASCCRDDLVDHCCVAGADPGCANLALVAVALKDGAGEAFPRVRAGDCRGCGTWPLPGLRLVLWTVALAGSDQVAAGAVIAGTVPRRAWQGLTG